MKKILLIINPVAGNARAKFRTFHIADWFYKRGYLTTALTTTQKGDATNFVKQYVNEHDIIVCYGGDGTLNEIISGLLQAASKTPVGYLPAGTTNDMAKTLHLPKNMKKAAKIIVNEKPIYQDIGIFNNTQYFSYIASFGAFTKASYATPQWLKNKFGHLAYVLDGIKSVGNIRPYRLKVISGDLQEEAEFIFGSVTNSFSVGGMFQFKSTDICLNDGKFEVLLIRNPRNMVQMRSIIYDLFHQKFDRDNILFFHTNKVMFQFEEETAWTVDGEFAGQPNEVYIENLHHAIKIIHKQ